MRRYKNLTDKQNELMDIAKGGLKRINILHGSVRSGKTWISLVLWCVWIQNMPKDAAYLMTAKTLTTLKRNCLDLLETLAGKNNFSYSISKKEGTLYGRRIYLEGVNDAGAESKIRGMTLQGAYCDEITLFTEEFFSMLLSRLSEKGAKLFGTTNPDNPNHWFKVKYIDRRDELDFFLMEFLIDDNTFLDSAYVKQLKKEYTGVFYKRFILGEWCSAEGLVYPMFDKEAHIVREIPKAQGTAEYYISIDYGTLNPCSMGLWRLDDKCAVRIKESYYSGKTQKILLTDEEYYERLKALAEGFDIKSIIIDPSAASFIATIRRYGEFSVRKADNSVLNGIRITGTLLQSGKLFIHESCADTIKEFGSYSWDGESQEDKVVKEFDHAMDDIRYFCSTVAKKRLL
ncbi:MAG: PBSX family phage terminase large subunit [Clostridia bacterium]|nr:PBSX family phage terminase large subunit [Clostridia bacterium]